MIREPWEVEMNEIARTTAKLLKCSILSIIPLLNGCGAHFNSIYRAHETGQNDMIISEDAKQRVVLRLKRRGDSSGVVTCAEPQPDALTVHAATGAANLALPQGPSVGGSGASSEAGTIIGLRTQTITLLRDQSYRICEAYINGAVGELDYAQLLRRNQVMLTAVLAIEQLTGAVVGPSAAIGASSSLTVDQTAIDKATTTVTNLEKERGTQKGTVDSKKQEVGVAEAKLKTLEGTADETEVEKARADRDTKQQQLLEEQAKLDGVDRALGVARQQLANARTPNLTTGTSSNLQGATIVTKDIPAVASAVRDIVQMAFVKEHILDLCQRYWTGLIPEADTRFRTTSDDYSTLLQVCSATFKNWLETVDALRGSGNGGTDLGAGVSTN
jgi:hypothetical protein